MPLSSIYRWVKKTMFTTDRGTHKNKQGRSRSFRPCLEQLEHRLVPTTVNMVFGGDYGNKSYAGVGFRENSVTELFASVNGQADPNKGDFQVQIQWGDGQSSPGDLLYEGTAGSGSQSVFLIKGSHTYSEQGYYTVIVNVTGPDESTASRQIQSYEVDALPSGVQGTQPPAATNTMGLADVSFTFGGAYGNNSYAGVGFQENSVCPMFATVNGEADPNLADFHAWINWGDSSSWTSADLVYEGVAGSGSQSVFLIKGSHIYNELGTFSAAVYVTGPDGTSASSSAGSFRVSAMPSGLPGTQPPAPATTMAPADVSLDYGGDYPINATAGVNFQNASVVTLYGSVNGEADPTVGDFHAEINWGDSSSWSSANLVYEGVSEDQALFLIQGSHAYAKPGTYYVVVYATGPDGTSYSGQTSEVEVAPSLLTLGNLSPTQWNLNEKGYEGTISVSGGTGGYQDLQVTGLPAGLSATVESTSGTVNGITVQNGTITISGTPTQSGTFNPQVTLADGNGDLGGGTYTLTIDVAALTLGSLSPTQWTQNEPDYNGTIAISGGTGT